MSKMTERELVAIIDEAERDGLTNSGTFLRDQEKYLEYYQGQPFGDEVEGRSRVVSTDVRDLVESDMPSLSRVFLGAGDPVEFISDTPDPQAIKEAKDKQAVVSHIIRSVPNSYRTQNAWLKASEIQDLAALEYGVEETKCAKYKRYKSLNEDELAAIGAQLESESDVTKWDIVETDEDEGSALFRITYTKKQYFLRNIPVEDLIISRNAWNKEDADVIGKRFIKTRSELVAAGFSRDLVSTLPTYETTTTNDNSSGVKQDRYKQQGGDESDSIKSWASERVRGEDVYMKVDYDDDGVAERRHIIKVGTEILVNDPFDHVPYAISSSMLMPNSLVGISRAAMVTTYQEVNSVLWRGSLDNMYAVNNPRHVYTDDIDVDDLLDIRLNGVIHSEGIPQQNLMTLETAYIGDKNLQLVQYMEGKKQASTGAMNQNQALEADQLHDETATRFKGMEDAGVAKIELVARNLAETGYKDLWEGIAWFATHFQDTRLELRILGREMTFNPAEWRYDIPIMAKVGTGAGDDDKTMANLTGIYTAQTQLMQEGSKLADDVKRYNTLAEMSRVAGRHDVSEFFNNPNQPEQIVTAERDMLKKMVQQLEAQGQNPLAEMEQIKQQGQMQIKQLEQKFQGQLKMLEMESDKEQEIAKLIEQHNKDLEQMKFDYAELVGKLEFDYTKLEVENGVDVPGKGVNQ